MFASRRFTAWVGLVSRQESSAPGLPRACPSPPPRLPPGLPPVSKTVACLKHSENAESGTVSARGNRSGLLVGPYHTKNEPRIIT